MLLSVMRSSRSGSIWAHSSSKVMRRRSRSVSCLFISGNRFHECGRWSTLRIVVLKLDTSISACESEPHTQCGEADVGIEAGCVSVIDVIKLVGHG